MRKWEESRLQPDLEKNMDPRYSRLTWKPQRPCYCSWPISGVGRIGVILCSRKRRWEMKVWIQWPVKFTLNMPPSDSLQGILVSSVLHGAKLPKTKWITSYPPGVSYTSPPTDHSQDIRVLLDFSTSLKTKQELRLLNIKSTQTHLALPFLRVLQVSPEPEAQHSPTTRLIPSALQG